MPFSLHGYTESQDSAVLVNVAALADQLIRVEGDNIIVPDLFRFLAGAYSLGPNNTRSQLVAPSLRELANIELKPLDVGAEPASPPPFIDWRANPIPLDPSEFLTAQAAEDAVGASRVTILVWLADGPIVPFGGLAADVLARLRTVRYTNTTTLVANALTNGALTADQTIPAGRYAVVGMRAESAGLQAARLVFPGGGPRPGCIGADAVSDHFLSVFRVGAFGVWGEFEHDQPPTVDFLSNSADTSQVVDLDLIQVRPGRRAIG